MHTSNAVQFRMWDFGFRIYKMAVPGQRTVVKHLARALGKRERIITMLRYADGLTSPEIAAVMGPPETAPVIDRTLDQIARLALAGLFVWRAA
ncbi:MAG: hypothetical protein KGL39_32745 [Patescibacteria group bacterium]|nr:hypothetical protein [Patescibacteria group bacterium]